MILAVTFASRVSAASSMRSTLGLRAESRPLYFDRPVVVQPITLVSILSMNSTSRVHCSDQYKES